ncbi:replication-relaxation family protein [Streptomyces sp. NPDC053474]|uniref:replication-relaxation family protein n=1 Tax=Streptomyces sp. NPDC053474 TaxID=3365704 RepID=UPI0037D1B62D
MTITAPAPHSDGPRVRGLSRLGQQLLPVLYQHRLVSTSQLRRLLTPHAASVAYVRRQLADLRRAGLAAATVRRDGRMGRGEHLWYITARGADIVEYDRQITTRAYRISPEAAASQLQEHTLAVVESGLAFTTWARALGDECGPLDWEPELAHRVRDGDSRLGDEAFVIPDAVLRYTRTTPSGRRQLLTYFIEVDRATMQAARLGAKLTAYARYASYIPHPAPGRPGPHRSREAWRERYPAFPRLLIVLTGASPNALARRIDDLRALADANELLHRSPLTAGVTTLTLLRDRGPFEPIVTPLLGDPAPRDILLAPHPVGDRIP